MSHSSQGRTGLWAIARRSIALLLLLSFTCLMTGCGSSNEEFVFTNTSPSSPATNNNLNGMLFLGVPVEGVPVELRSLNGEVLATQTTDVMGNFIFPGPHPPDFRLVATLSNGSQFSREVRDFAGQEYAVINVPTTLVSLLAQGNTEESLEVHRSSIRAKLGLPSNSDLNFVEESVGIGFSHIAFFARAANAGGLGPFIQSIATSGAGPSSRFLLRENTLDSPLSDLAPELMDRLQAHRSDQRLRLSVRMLMARGLDNRESLSLESGVNAQFGEVVGGLVASVAAGLVTNVISDGVGVVYTWVAEQLGWHYGTTVEMDEILQAIQGVADGVQAIANTQTQQEIQNGIDAMNTAVTSITSDTNSLINAISKANQDENYFSNEPSTSTLPTDITNYLNVARAGATIENYNSYLTLMAQWMTGASQIPVGNNPPIVVESNYDAQMNLIDLTRLSVLQEQNGITLNSGTQAYMHFPVRTSNFLDQVLQPWQNYAVYQSLAAYQLAEAAHSSGTPASEIVSAQVAIDNMARSLQSQRGQVPAYPPSDRVFIDMQYGLMWWMDIQGATSYSSATTAYFNPTLEGGHSYGDWRLPTFNEAKALQLRGVYAAAAANGHVDFGNPVSGLNTLGFNTSGLNSDGEFWVANWEIDDGLFGDDSWSFDNKSLKFRATHESNNYLYDASGDFPYFMVRTLGPRPLIKIDEPGSISGPKDTWPSQFNNTLQEWEQPYLATFTGFSNIGTSNNQVTWNSNWNFYIGVWTDFALGTSTVSGSGHVDRDGNAGPYSSSTNHPPVYFNQDDSSRVSVSNYETNFGAITPHLGANQSTPIHLFALGYANNTFPTNIQATVNSPISTPQITLTGLQISPRNMVMSVETTDEASQQFVATGFYSDGTVEDLTGQVTWTVTGVPNGASFAEGDPGLLKLEKASLPDQPTATLTVQATINVSGNPTKVGDDNTTVLVQID